MIPSTQFLSVLLSVHCLLHTATVRIEKLIRNLLLSQLAICACLSPLPASGERQEHSFLVFITQMNLCYFLFQSSFSFDVKPFSSI